MVQEDVNSKKIYLDVRATQSDEGTEVKLNNAMTTLPDELVFHLLGDLVELVGQYLQEILINNGNYQCIVQCELVFSEQKEDPDLTITMLDLVGIEEDEDAKDVK